MASEEEVTQVANVADAIELTQDKDIVDSHEDVPNVTADLSEVEPESGLDNVPPPLPIEEPSKEVIPENTAEVKEPPSEDVESIQPIVPTLALDESQVADVTVHEDVASSANDDEPAAALAPIAGGVAPPETSATSSVDEAKAPPAKEPHEAAPTNEPTEPTIPATTSVIPDDEASSTQPTVVEPEPQHAETTSEVVQEAVPSAPVDPLVSEGQTIPAVHVEASPVVATVDPPAPTTEGSPLVVLVSSEDETCYTVEDTPQGIEPSLPIPEKELASQDPVEALREIVADAPEEVEPQVEPILDVVNPPVEEVPTPIEQPVEPVLLVIEETAVPVVDEVRVAANGTVFTEPELEQEVLPEIRSNEVEVKSEKIESSNAHADFVLEDKVSIPSEQVVVLDAPVDVLQAQESVADVKEEPASDEPRGPLEEVAVIEEVPVPAELTTAPVPEQPKPIVPPAHATAQETTSSQPVVLVESTEVCVTLPPPDEDHADVEAITVSTSRVDIEGPVVPAPEAVVPVVEIDVGVPGPVPPTTESATEVPESKPTEVVADVPKADTAAAEEASRSSTEILPPEIVVDEDRDPEEHVPAQTSDHQLITESADSLATASVVVDNVGEAEKTDAQIAQDQVVADIERPKSPWRPSYSVTTQGPGVADADVPNEVDVDQETTDAPLDTGAEKVVEVVAGNGTAIVTPAESASDSLSASAEELSKSSSWPKSYSVSSQGASPVHAPQKTEDDDVKPLESAPQPEQVIVQPSATTQPIETEVAPQEIPAPSVTEAAPKEAEQEQVVEVPPESQPQEIVEPQARAAFKQTPTRQFFANWVALADPNHDDTGSIHSVHSNITGPDSVFIPKLQVEGKAATAPVPPERPWTPSYSVIRQGTADAEPVAEPPSDELVVPAVAERDDEDDLEVRSFTEQEPKWTPSYSVSQQGSNSKELVTEEQPTEEDETPERPWTPSYSVVKQGSTPATPRKQDGEPERPWTPSYSVIKQGNSTPKSGDDVFLSDSDPQVFPTTEAVENGRKVSDKPSLSRLAPLHEDRRVETSGIPELDAYSQTNGRARLESTTSSRFFPGGWFSSSPKSPDENGAILENANGEFSKTSANGVTSPVVEAPANTPVDGIDTHQKHRWCVVM